MSPDAKPTKPIDIYVRVSQTRGRSGDSFQSPDQQEQRCRAQLAADGLTVGKVLTDLDQSGGKSSRPAFDEALRRARTGESGGIIVHDLTRFGRYATMAQDVIKLEEDGALFISCAEKIDTATSSGRFFLRVMEAMAVMYREQVGERLLTSKANAVANGIHISRDAPPGYIKGKDRRLVPDPVYGSLITEAFARASQGERWNVIAAFLTREGLPSRGKPTLWESNRIRRLLANRVYLGEARDGHGNVCRGAHDPLVDEATFLLAQREKIGPTIGVQDTHLLAGLCRCASCSYALKWQGARGGSVDVYRCRGTAPGGKCPKPVVISAKKLETFVLDSFVNTIGEHGGYIGGSESDASYETAKAAAVHAQREYESLQDDKALLAALGAAEFSRVIQTAHAVAQEALAAIPEPSTQQSEAQWVTLRDMMVRFYEHGETQAMRDVLSNVIDAIFVAPAESSARNQPVEGRVLILGKGELERLNIPIPKRGERFAPAKVEWERQEA